MKVIKSLLLFIFVGVISASTNAAQLCIVRLDCPPNYHNDTIRVANNVVALNRTFTHCTPDSINETLPGKGADTISVFFLIDHSSSMSIMDSTAIRYRVVNQLIDSIYAISPASEIGLAVFSNQLLHSSSDDPFYVQLDSRWHDSYVPLSRLSGKINNVSAVEKLKSSIVLSAEKDYFNNFKLLNGNYSPTGRKDTLGNNLGYNGTTDISLAFDAARKAFLNAANPKEKQYIVFLSDGISQNVDIERKTSELDYITGAGVPTTFTAFFVNVNKPIPQQISSMTENIRANGYSSNNVNSKEWKTMGSESELLGSLLGRLSIGAGTEYYTSYPKKLTLNGIAGEKFDDSLAYLPKIIPLTGKYTQVDISFSFRWNSPIDKDETRTFSTTIMQSDNPDRLPDSCFEQGTLQFLYQGNQISNIEAQQRNLEVRFFPPQGFEADTVEITVSNSTSTDSIKLKAFRSGEYYSAVFSREYGTPRVDNVLQNAFTDSVIAFYRNQDLPLDTLRISARVTEPSDIAVRSAYYLDTNANGYPDIIRVVQGTEKLSPSDIALVKPNITLLTPRSLSVINVIASPVGFDIILDEPAGVLPFTGIFPDERLYIDRTSGLPDGGELPQTDVPISDSMAPVIISGTYFDHAEKPVTDTIEVVFSEKINPSLDPNPFEFFSVSQNKIYSLSLRHLKDDSVSLYSVLPVIAGTPDPMKGDSIKIRPLSGIKDDKNVEQQNPGNIRRAMQYYLLYTISGAAYFDQTGDGLIDMVKVYMPVAADSMLLDKLYETISLPAHRNFTYSKKDIIPCDEGFIINVKQPETTVPYTATDSSDILNISYTEALNGSLIKPVSVPIDDSLAPVIIEAFYIPSKGSSELETDSLIVTLSENIAVPSSTQPFTFFDPIAGKSYSMELKYSRADRQSVYIFSILDIIGKEYPQAVDSVCINPSSGVRDLKENIQDSLNRYTHLKFKAQEYDYQIISYPNPFDPQKSLIPPGIVTNYGLKQNRGVVIIAEPSTPMAGYVDLMGEMILYDVVGNKVRSIKGEKVRTGKGLYFVWNGENPKKRLVGTGTYLAVITLSDTQGFKTIKKHKIGIRRYVYTDKYFSFETH